MLSTKALFTYFFWLLTWYILQHIVAIYETLGQDSQEASHMTGLTAKYWDQGPQKNV